MYDSEDDYDSDEEPEFLSEEDMEFLSDHQQDAALGQQTKQSVWGVIDKAKLVHVQVSKPHASWAVPRQFNCHAMYFVHMQDQSLAAVQGILGCSRDTARKLLTYFQWDKEALFGMLHPTLRHKTQILYVKITWAKHAIWVQAPWQIEAKKLCIRPQA